MAESKKKAVTKKAPKKSQKTTPKKVATKKAATLPKKVSKKKIAKTVIKKTTPKKSKTATKKTPQNKTLAKKKVSKKAVSKKVIRKTPNKNKKAVVKKTPPKKKILGKKREILKRHHENPIVTPRHDSVWESRATFNPSALLHDGVIHLVYRAMGDSDISVLGYAESKDGLSFDKKSHTAVYAHQYKNDTKEKSLTTPILYSSGGGWNGGCEDPRLTKIDDTVYMTYTAFDGWGSVRVALTSISLDDFIQNAWNWKEPVLISPPHEIHKNWVLFPEKINDSYAILHAISPEIFVEYIDDINRLDGDNFIHSIHQGSPSWKLRERGVRGVGPAPIKTKYGWLVLYHKTEDHDPYRYKIFAMILDLKDPTKILYKSRGPILEPDEHYENNGHKGGVIYSCGAIVKDNTLFVYYGGADTVTCVAVANLDEFLKELTTSGISRLIKQKK